MACGPKARASKATDSTDDGDDGVEMTSTPHDPSPAERLLDCRQRTPLGLWPPEGRYMGTGLVREYAREATMGLSTLHQLTYTSYRPVTEKAPGES